MVFWILISFVALAMTALLGLVLLRAHSVGEPPAAYDLRVYRQQLSDVDKDLQRGVINESDAQRIRTEVSRRILAADAQLQNQSSGSTQPKGVSRVTVLLSAALLTWGWHPGSRPQIYMPKPVPIKPRPKARSLRRQTPISSPAMRIWWNNCAKLRANAPMTRRGRPYWRNMRPILEISSRPIRPRKTTFAS